MIKINDKPAQYKKDYMKFKFNSDDDLPLNKILKFHNLMVIVRLLVLKKMVNSIHKFS